MRATGCGSRLARAARTRNRTTLYRRAQGRVSIGDQGSLFRDLVLDLFADCYYNTLALQSCHDIFYRFRRRFLAEQRSEMPLQRLVTGWSVVGMISQVLNRP